MTQTTDLETLTDADIEAIRSLRHRGFAVIVWTPEELGECRVKDIEDRSVEHGWQVIEWENA